MQTIAYYVKQSSSGTTTSLYRRVFNGDPAGGVEQELVEDVESLQVKYGVDTTSAVADGIVDSYVTAEAVTDWSDVVAVRMGLLLRSSSKVAGDLSVAASAPVNGRTINYPSGSKYDRRVFTTTVAVRNRITYF
jgi:type IV pilus assembly protein PilW